VSLIDCPECGRQISTAAIACPGCGYPAAQAFAPPPRARTGPTLAAVAALALLGIGGATWMGVGPFHALRHHHFHGRHHERTVEVIRVEAPAMHVPPPPEVVVAPPLVRTLELSDVDLPPELMNQAEVMRTMQRAYPPLLRDAGVEGQAVVRFRVLPDGRVDAGSVSIEHATHDAFGLAALRVAHRMRFRPAELDGAAVSAWVALPLSFQPMGDNAVEVF
jgi:TonB family protein